VPASWGDFEPRAGTTSSRTATWSESASPDFEDRARRPSGEHAIDAPRPDRCPVGRRPPRAVKRNVLDGGPPPLIEQLEQDRAAARAVDPPRDGGQAPVGARGADRLRPSR